MNELINELINYKAVYRTAPAAPGLLITGAGAGYFSFFRQSCVQLFRNILLLLF